MKIPDEQKWQIVQQIEAREITAQQAAAQLGISRNTVYRWLDQWRLKQSHSSVTTKDILLAENRRLKAELLRVTEERDILKKAALLFAQ
nr:helix-turn-helix domain-containing protein [Chitinolyticbacter albus]